MTGSTYNKKRAAVIIAMIVASCAVMAFIEIVIEPTYAIKSIIKVVLFLGLPATYCLGTKIKLSGALKIPMKKLVWLLLTGAAVYGVIMLAYSLSGNVFNYGEIVSNLSSDQNVTKESFLPVSIYISFGNSLIEEVLFRLFGFLILSEFLPRKFAYVFSSMAFAIYHIGMIGQTFPPILIVLSLIGLAAGGFIFDWFDNKFKSFYCSWFIHMFADFAIMTIWYLNI